MRCSAVWTSEASFASVACGPLQLRSNGSEHCSAMWTSKTGLALVAFGPLQLRSNVSERLLVPYHWLIRLIFIRVNRWDLLRIRCLHAVHVFGVANDIWDAERHLRRTATLVFNSVELLTLLRPRYCSFRLFLLLFFMNCLELIVRPKKTDLSSFALLRNGFWTLLQQVNCFTLTFCTEKLRVFNEWSVV